MPSACLKVKSFAKINLYLQILKKRPDNYHNLKTLFARIDLFDRIILRALKTNGIKIKSLSRQIPKDATNICFRAAALLKKEFNLNHGIEIEIQKRIPVGAGLGGGSANAASVLLGLNRYWNLNLSKTKLLKLAARLGSDVPFFIKNVKFALGAGRGEKITPLPKLARLKLWLIVIYPGCQVATALIYEKFDQFSQLTRPGSNVKLLTSELSQKGAKISPQALFNSLEDVTTRVYPVVGEAKKALLDAGLDKVLMSGSGAAVFAICNNRRQAEVLSRKIARQHKIWKVFVSRIV